MRDFTCWLLLSHWLAFHHSSRHTFVTWPADYYCHADLCSTTSHTHMHELTCWLPLSHWSEFHQRHSFCHAWVTWPADLRSTTHHSSRTLSWLDLLTTIGTLTCVPPPTTTLPTLSWLTLLTTIVTLTCVPPPAIAVATHAGSFHKAWLWGFQHCSVCWAAYASWQRHLTQHHEVPRLLCSHPSRVWRRWHFYKKLNIGPKKLPWYKLI